jgi:hypothetical protein
MVAEQTSCARAWEEEVASQQRQPAAAHRGHQVVAVAVVVEVEPFPVEVEVVEALG